MLLRVVLAAALCVVLSSGATHHNPYCELSEMHTMCQYEGIGPACKRVEAREVDHEDINVITSARGTETGRSVCLQARLQGVPSARPFRRGQNLAVTHGADKGKQPNWKATIRQWFDEVRAFNHSNIKPFKFSHDFGHFTQMVWATTQMIGCGYSMYFAGGQWNKLYVCNYGPMGNVLFDEVYEAGPSCSRCPAGTQCSTHYPGLCAGGAKSGHLQAGTSIQDLLNQLSGGSSGQPAPQAGGLGGQSIQDMISQLGGGGNGGQQGGGQSIQDMINQLSGGGGYGGQQGGGQSNSIQDMINQLGGGGYGGQQGGGQSIQDMINQLGGGGGYGGQQGGGQSIQDMINQLAGGGYGGQQGGGQSIQDMINQLGGGGGYGGQQGGGQSIQDMINQLGGGGGYGGQQGGGQSIQDMINQLGGGGYGGQQGGGQSIQDMINQLGGGGNGYVGQQGATQAGGLGGQSIQDLLNQLYGSSAAAPPQAHGSQQHPAPGGHRGSSGKELLHCDFDQVSCKISFKGVPWKPQATSTSHGNALTATVKAGEGTEVLFEQIIQNPPSQELCIYFSYMKYESQGRQPVPLLMTIEAMKSNVVNKPNALPQNTKDMLSYALQLKQVNAPMRLHFSLSVPKTAAGQVTVVAVDNIKVVPGQC
ncbi:uncharacterized PE-PGRS family protein PE_PGRS54-like [Amphibalanus amphitrite]|uniref:uncharacterized PE-PGRS family protein PE_PGRS54-like n=1 Tax=Amphibalanus amphitrite TaxID=1232801 RepID=UPI001C91D803|nr:uncharacterized PE-PGRS family protein PE_PGRS54-like [Amphibalanus amphitrite]